MYNNCQQTKHNLDLVEWASSCKPYGYVRCKNLANVHVPVIIKRIRQEVFLGDKMGQVAIPTSLK